MLPENRKLRGKRDELLIFVASRSKVEIVSHHYTQWLIPFPVTHCYSQWLIHILSDSSLFPVTHCYSQWLMSFPVNHSMLRDPSTFPVTHSMLSEPATLPVIQYSLKDVKSEKVLKISMLEDLQTPIIKKCSGTTDMASLVCITKHVLHTTAYRSQQKFSDLFVF